MQNILSQKRDLDINHKYDAWIPDNYFVSRTPDILSMPAKYCGSSIPDTNTETDILA